MAGILVENPFGPILGLDGEGLDSGKVYIGVSGQNPRTNPQLIYDNPELTGSSLPQPLRTMAGYLYYLGSPVRPYCADPYSIAVDTDADIQIFYEPTIGEVPTQATTEYNTLPDLVAATVDPLITTVIVFRYDTGYPPTTMTWEEVPNVGTVLPWQVRSNGNTRRWELAVSIVLPAMLGCVCDGVADDTIPLQSFLDYVTHRRTKSAQWVGVFRVTSAIVWDAGAYPYRAEIVADCNIIADFTGEGEVLRFKDHQDGLNITGKLVVWGINPLTPATSWASRTVGDGVVIDGCFHFRADFIQTVFFKYHGVKVLESSPLPEIDYVRARYCGTEGTGAQGKVISVTAVSDTGSTGSVSQTSVLTVSEVPAGITAGVTTCVINGDIYLIKAKGASTITVFPWVRRAQALPVNCALHMGAGFDIVGADSSVGRIGTLDTLSCAVGLYNRALYHTSVGVHVTQACGVGHLIGVESGGALGGTAGNSYFETNAFDIVKIQPVGPGYDFTATVALNWAKCRSLGPRRTDNTFEAIYALFYGMTIGVGGQVYTLQENYPEGGAGYDVTPGPQQFFPMMRYFQNNNDINLVPNEDLIRLFDLKSIEFRAAGTGINREPTGTYTFTTEPGYTVNGGASEVYTGMTGPCSWSAKLNGLDWRVVQDYGGP